MRRVVRLLGLSLEAWTVPRMTQPAHSRIIVRFIATLVATVVAVLGLVGMPAWMDWSSGEAAAIPGSSRSDVADHEPDDRVRIEQSDVVERRGSRDRGGVNGGTRRWSRVERGVPSRWSVTPRVHNHFVNGDHGSRFGGQEE